MYLVGIDSLPNDENRCFEGLAKFDTEIGQQTCTFSPRDASCCRFLNAKLLIAHRKESRVCAAVPTSVGALFELLKCSKFGHDEHSELLF